MKSVEKQVKLRVKNKVWSQISTPIWDNVWDVVRLQVINSINYKVMDLTRMQVYHETS